METVASYPCFGLSREDVSVRVVVWDGEIQHHAEAEMIWLQMRGLNPKWCRWDTLDMVVSAFGVLVDIDWVTSCQDLSECIRVKMYCKDSSKIPTERSFELGKKFYLVKLTVEPIVASTASGSSRSGNGEPLSTSSMEADKSSEASDTGSLNRNSGVLSNTMANHPSASDNGGTRTVQALLDQEEEDPEDSPIDSSSPAAFLKKKVPEIQSATSKTLDDMMNGAHMEQEQCFNLLRDMELVDEDGQFNYFNEDEEELRDEQEKMEDTPLDMTTEAEKYPDKQQKWGPVYGTRQSGRLINTGKTIMELAQEKQMIKNLEKPPPPKNKGAAEDSSFGAGLAYTLQGSGPAPDRSVLSENFEHPPETDAAGKWLGLRWTPPSAAFPPPSSPPSSPKSDIKKSLVLSPASPLDAGCWSPSAEGARSKKLKHSSVLITVPEDFVTSCAV